MIDGPLSPALSDASVFAANAPHGDDLALIRRLADAARAAVAPYFRVAGLGVDNKAATTPGRGRFDPVTEGDRAVERAIRAILAAERPEDGILGEEYDAVVGRSGRVWVLDPIDGTRAFMSGLPMWGVLIALEIDGRASLGAMDQPWTRERFIGVGPPAGRPRLDGRPGGARLERDGQSTDLRTRPCAALGDAILFATAPEIFSGPGEFEAFERVRADARMTRYGTDCYGYAMVAAGCADLVIEAGLAPYDIQALIPVIEGAGGIVTDWTGGPAEPGGQVIAAGDRRVHAAAMARLAGA
jgi:histidinol phosphatase-like enzyme (inositol monophosphatase family)